MVGDVTGDHFNTAMIFFDSNNVAALKRRNRVETTRSLNLFQEWVSKGSRRCLVVEAQVAGAGRYIL